MSTEAQSDAVIEVAGIRVTIVRKALKNVHLAVYPPDGWVRAAVPLAVSDEVVRVAVVGKLRWIRQQQAVFASQVRQSPREMVSGESHYFLGHRYRLDVVEGPLAVRVKNRSFLELSAPRGLDAAGRERALHRWYRTQLRVVAEPLIAKWEALLGVHVAAWSIKRMKTRWGSCNEVSGRVWLNLELAKKEPGCIEYVVVHELAHLISRRHDARFVGLLDRHLPRWRSLRDLLNVAPLASESWGAGRVDAAG